VSDSALFFASQMEEVMKTVLAVVTVAAAIALAPTGAAANERLVDGGLGAGAGLLAFGPAGALAGGIIGYTAGPNIASSLGVRHHRYHRNVKHVRESRDTPR
jgi:hypothetical protein